MLPLVVEALALLVVEALALLWHGKVGWIEPEPRIVLNGGHSCVLFSVLYLPYIIPLFSQKRLTKSL